MKNPFAIALLFLVALSGCNQGYAGPNYNCDEVPDKCMGEAPYRNLTEPVLISVLRGSLQISTDDTPIQSSEDPTLDPVTFLDAHADSFRTGDDGLWVSGAYKIWLFASMGACQVMVQKHYTTLFPGGHIDYTFIYESLMMRDPTPAEVARLDEMRASFQSDEAQKVAVCTAVTNTLEFLRE